MSQQLRGLINLLYVASTIIVGCGLLVSECPPPGFVQESGGSADGRAPLSGSFYAVHSEGGFEMIKFIMRCAHGQLPVRLQTS